MANSCKSNRNHFTTTAQYLLSHPPLINHERTLYLNWKPVHFIHCCNKCIYIPLLFWCDRDIVSCCITHGYPININLYTRKTEVQCKSRSRNSTVCPYLHLYCWRSLNSATYKHKHERVNAFDGWLNKSLSHSRGACQRCTHTANTLR